MNNELYHYGVLGMKWGIRHDPKKAYAKAQKKQHKLDKKDLKLQKKVDKATSRLSRALPSRMVGAQRYRQLMRREARLKLAEAKASSKSKAWAVSVQKAFANIPLSELMD